MSDEKDLEERLSALEADKGTTTSTREKPSPKAAIAGVAAIAALGLVAYMAIPSDEPEPTMETAQPAEFQAEGDGFGEIAPFEPPAPPDPEIVEVERPENAALQEQLAALQAQLEEMRNAPSPDTSDTTAAMEAMTERMEALQAASDEAREQYQADMAERDRELQRLRSELEIARLDQQNPMGPGPGRSDEDARLAELERRREEAAAFQEARINSPMVAFGNSGAGGDDGSEMSERTLGAVTDFVMNGATPSQVTQAEVIANPANTVVQGTMIQAVTETALDSSLPGQMRAIISEDVHSYDGSRVLIPRGSRLIGRYRSGLDVGQQRVTVAWDRIILPNNQTVQISSFGGDELGRSGVSGFVDTRFGERFGSAALISLLGAVPSVAASEIDDDTASDAAEDVGDDFQSATDNVMSEYLSLGPVIYVDQGSRITVMVDRDLEIF
ncbi:type IV secretion system protein VirB10 [Roseivivax halotolerans]|uniref:Type IV secretion system protein VirB10 n=1 Tax=Roseivivax halotolerans TaxID=93684 RepID=A0A1I6AIK5_9RHOB|nr:TrbI/VirB10 family protein [Roseivivax halotolerans]SFQ68529.1 type IV secretion system protein VirB10 [Roseivivax halotolerans]